jgi:bifunctional aspartokinase / homoserine dehydrogenase 1
MKVLKFGGSSVANAENIKKSVAIVVDSTAADRCVAVFSAMQGTTDDLIAAGRFAERGEPAGSFHEAVRKVRDRHLEAVRGLFNGNSSNEVTGVVESYLSEVDRLCDGVALVGELSARTLDRILSFGELLSTKIIAASLKERGIQCDWKDTRDLIRTDSRFGSASVEFGVTDRQIKQFVDGTGDKLIVVPGFIASDASGTTTTLGRGGSDYTAAIFAAAVNAEVLEIWTDVSGMMSADPRLVRNVREIRRTTYREAMELSHFGAKVIYPPTIHPVMAKSIPIKIKNTFDPKHPGTVIQAETEDAGEIIRGISSIDNISVLNLEGSGMVGIPGFSKRLFDALSRAEINVILITQSSSEHSICVGIEEKFATLAKEVVDREFEHEINVGKIEPLKVEKGFAVLAVVGDNMKSHTGVSGRLFSTLGQNGINIHAIAQGSSERNISAIISAADVKKAVNTLHEEFFSDGKKQINIFVAGVGTVGKKLLGQISQQRDFIAEDLRLSLRVAGIANSKKALLADDGLREIDLDFNDANSIDSDRFADEILARNLRNSIFVDVTASTATVAAYPRLLQRSVSIIACNKIACSSEYESYQYLKDLSREYNANFFFETNVGAGLPVIHTLADLLRSGDRVNRIEAVLSGTLNFVFNNYDGSRKFAEVVRQAQTEGYTEPDPRLDLSGTDVARKILILAREAGNKLEMSDVENTPFLPGSCFAGTVEDFYAEMERNEEHFNKMLEKARSEGKILKYIATFDGERASVGLQSIRTDHNFANLSGKDNAVLFYTDRYSEQPLVIKGAGAGADVTAAGVFADIIRASR